MSALPNVGTAATGHLVLLCDSFTQSKCSVEKGIRHFNAV